MSEADLIERLAAALAERLRPAIPLSVDLWDMAMIAAYFKRDPQVVRCLVSCDHIPRRSWPLFRAKAMLDELIADLAPRSQNQHKTAPEPSRT